jgi:hypothetical protein
MHRATKHCHLRRAPATVKAVIPTALQQTGSVILTGAHKSTRTHTNTILVRKLLAEVPLAQREYITKRDLEKNIRDSYLILRECPCHGSQKFITSDVHWALILI